MSIQNRSVCKRLLLVFTVSLGVSFLGMGAEWAGFWGGWMGQPTEIPHFPNTEAYEPGRWQFPPIYYELIDTAVHAWTSVEKAVVQAVVAELNSGFLQIEGDFLILEHPGARCQDCPVNIQIRWEDPSTFFRNWGDVNGDKMAFSAAGYVGVYLPIQVAPVLGVDPCPDLKAAGSPVRCSTVVLNWANPEGWFIDSTPEQDEEFELKTVSLCGQKQTQLKALPRGPAAGKQDLYTVLLHEICHAIGLIHSGGCDRTLLRSSPRDDDGRLMWEGYLEYRRILESRDVGKGERRHMAEGDRAALKELYPPEEYHVSRVEDKDPLMECVELLAKSTRREYKGEGSYTWYKSQYRRKKCKFFLNELEIYKDSPYVSERYRRCARDLLQADWENYCEPFWDIFAR